MSEIASKYPEFLDLVDAERSSTEQLSSALQVLNLQYENKIKLALIDEKQTKITEKQTDLFKRQRQVIEKLVPLLAKYGFSDVSFSELSSERQKQVATEILDKEANIKFKQQQDQIRYSRSEFAGVREGQQGVDLANARDSFEEFQKVNNELEKERLHQIDLANAQQKSNINNLKEKLKQEEAELKIMKQKGAENDLIIAQEKLIQGIKNQINPPKPPKSNNTDTPKKGKKQKSPYEIDIETIEKNQKLAEDLERQRFEEEKKNRKTEFEAGVFDREEYNNALELEETEHNYAMLSIDEKFSKERLDKQIQYFKKAEAEATKANIAEIQNKTKDISLALKKRAEELLKQAIDGARKISNELDILLRTEEQNKIDLVNKKYEALRDEKITENIDSLLKQAEYNLSVQKQYQEEDNKLYSESLVIKYINEINTHKEALETKRKLDIQYEKEKNAEILKIQKDFYFKRLDEEEKEAMQKLEIFSETEQNKYDNEFGNPEVRAKNFANLLDDLDEKDNLLMDRVVKGKKQIEKKEKEHAKNLEKIERAKQIAILAVQEDTIKKKIADLKKKIKLQIDGLVPTNSESLKDNKNELIALLSQLSNVQRQTKEQSNKKGDTVTKTNKNGKERTFSYNDNGQLHWFSNETIEIINKIADSIDETVGLTVTATNTIVNALEQAVDREIAIRERRVDKALQIAERGNAEALQIEEERLRKAQAQKEKYARTQVAVNSVMQISNALTAISRAVLEGGGFGSIATVAAVIAALASGYAAVTQMTTETPQGFATGVVGLNGTGTTTSDSIPARLSKGESVITAKGTGLEDNAEILRMMNKGVGFKIPSLKNIESPVISKKSDVRIEMEGIKKGLENVVQAVESIKPSSVIIDKEGFVAMSQIIEDRTRRRDKL